MTRVTISGMRGGGWGEAGGVIKGQVWMKGKDGEGGFGSRRGSGKWSGPPKCERWRRVKERVYINQYQIYVYCQLKKSFINCVIRFSHVKFSNSLRYDEAKNVLLFEGII